MGLFKAFNYSAGQGRLSYFDAAVRVLLGFSKHRVAMARSFINIFNVVLAFGQYYNSSQSKVFNSSTKVVNKKIKKVNECMNYFRKTFLIKKGKIIIF